MMIMCTEGRKEASRSIYGTIFVLFENLGCLLKGLEKGQITRNPKKRDSQTHKSGNVFFCLFFCSRTPNSVSVLTGRIRNMKVLVGHIQSLLGAAFL
jgi:hypothetical protein